MYSGSPVETLGSLFVARAVAEAVSGAGREDWLRGCRRLLTREPRRPMFKLYAAARKVAAERAGARGGQGLDQDL